MASTIATVVEFWPSELNNDTELIAMCNGFRTNVAIFEKDLEKSPLLKDQYLKLLQVAQHPEIEEAQEDEDQSTIEDLHDWLLDGCMPKFFRLLPPPNYPPGPTLEH